MQLDFQPNGTLVLTATCSLEAFTLQSFMEKGSKVECRVLNACGIPKESTPITLNAEKSEAQVIKLVEAKKEVAAPASAPAPQPEPVTIPEPTPTPAPQGEEFQTDKAHRENVKAQLISLGVAFDNKQKTATLEKMLEKAKINQPSLAIDTPIKPATQAQVEAPTPTPAAPVQAQGDLKDKAIEVCRAYALSHGQDAARALVESFGVKRISELSDSQKLELLQKIEAATNPSNVFA